MVREERQHDLGVVVNLADQFVLTEEAIEAHRIGGIGDIDDVISHALGETVLSATAHAPVQRMKEGAKGKAENKAIGQIVSRRRDFAIGMKQEKLQG